MARGHETLRECRAATMKTSTSTPALPTLDFPSQSAWADWLEANHTSSPGLWLRLAKKGSRVASVTYAEAVESALCYGWIDGQKDSHDALAWLQKFTPRGPRSIWSKINREKIAVLTAAGRMRPAGLAAVERAKRGGQWEAAYDPPSTSTVPPDFQAALDASATAKAFYGTLNSANRYAILFRIQNAKKAETRARKIAELTAMLERNEKLHP
jgi:uncharacterized protein YdeI (YjbR/CyaY-like superfamily)